MTSRFLTPLVAKQIDGENWELTQALVFDHGGDVITVPTGFVTDYASTPQAIWFLMPKSGLWDAAAVVHDYLYRLGGKLPCKTYTKPEADLIFKDGMEALGVSSWKRWAMYQAVRLFGHGAFTK